MEPKRVECEPGYHRLFALEPFCDEKTGAVTVVLVCTSCGHPIRFDFNVLNTEPFRVIE